MDIKVEPEQDSHVRFQASNAEMPNINIKMEPGLETDSSLKSVSELFMPGNGNAEIMPNINIKMEPGLETESGLKSILEPFLPEAQSAMPDLIVKMEPPDLCTDFSSELPYIAGNAEVELRDMGGMAKVNMKTEPGNQTGCDVGQLLAQDIEPNGLAEQYLEPQPVMFVQNRTHLGCSSAEPGTSADYALMSLATEPTSQMIAVSFEDGDGTYLDCSFNAVVENIAFVADRDGSVANAVKEEELSDDDVIIVEPEEMHESTPSCSTMIESPNKGNDGTDESESSGDSDSSNESDGTSDEADAVPEQKFECQYCGKTFSTKFYHGKHERLHNGEKPYKCKQCGRYFSSMWELIDHMHIHAKALTHTCQYCGEVFQNYGYWRQHESAHGDKRLHCKLCGRVFTKRLYLLHHKKSVHALDVKHKPLKCRLCTKTFQRIQDLDLHRSTHVKDIECNQCDEKFNLKQQLSRHRNKMH